jgi:hypothetical protein
MPYAAYLDQDGNIKVEYKHRDDRGFRRTRAQLLAELNTLSDGDLVSANHAAAYIGTSPGSLANWRQRRVGPPFIKGKARFIRYRIADLKIFVASQLRETNP